MNVCVTILILAALESAHTAESSEEQQRHPEAIEVFSCDFENPSDTDYDLWPDGWTRRRGRGFPAYLKLEIVDNPKEPLAPGKRCLQCNLDGGAVAAFSPHMPIGAEFSYLLEAYVNCNELKHDRAYYAVTFCDANKKPLETVESAPVTGTSGWQRVRIGPLMPSNRRAQFAQISLHVDPEADADITGSVQFDDIWFGRFPRVVLEANNEHLIYTDGKKVLVTCRATGMSDPNTLINFELLDVNGNRLAGTESPLQQDANAVINVSETPGLRPAPKNEGNVFSGHVDWSPPIRDYGFYRVRISMLGRSGLAIERSMNIVVVPPFTPRESGEFGWSLPNGENPLPMRALAPLLGQCGIHWLKFPVWYGTQPGDRDLADRLSSFVERLDSYGIQMVGMLDQPPSDIRQLFEDKGRLPVASVFVDREMWKSAIDPVMMRMSLKIRWWQLGTDTDTSFVEFPNLEKRIQEIQQHVSRFGQDVEVGFPWQAANALPLSRKPPWSFLSIMTDPPFTSQETYHYLAEPAPQSVLRWITLQPISKQHYDLTSRTLDLVSRMIMAKAGGADGIFISDPFDASFGLMESNGQPSELFIPWRTTARMLSVTNYVGRLELPMGSPNVVFSRGNEAIMAVWNDVPTQERLYLGQNIQVTDPWGHTRNVPNETEDRQTVQTIDVQRMPQFVTGLSLPIAKWRANFRLQSAGLASVFGKEQPFTYQYQNSFAQSAGGEIALMVPGSWEISPRRQMFKLAPGQEQSETAYVTLKSDSSSGVHRVGVDVRLTADQEYAFKVYGSIRVGQDDIAIELSTRLDETGNIVVDEHVINRNNRPISLNCLLFVPDRRRLRRQVFTPAHGRTSVSYVLSNASDLIGKTLWLRAEEINGARVLNYHVVAEP